MIMEGAAMGWVKTRAGKDGRPQHTAMYRDLHGRERSAGTYSTKKQATRAWHNAEAALSAGRVGDPKRGRQRFGDYVENEWFPNHVLEESTREGYRHTLDKYVLPEFGAMRMVEILPADVRAWIKTLESRGVRPPTIRQCKVVLDAVLTTAVNDQITFLHAGKGVKTPAVAKKAKRLITAEHYERIHSALPDDTMRLLVETDIESGLRWGELTELRPKDIDFETGLLTVSRVVVHLKSAYQPDGPRFLVKEYPKDKEWRQLKLADHLVTKLKAFIETRGIGSDNLLFEQPRPDGPTRRRRPETLPDPDTLGWTDPNEKGRRYRHGTLTGYQAGRCRCRHCKDALADYRARRRAKGRDSPRRLRTVTSDGHISGDWFRQHIWNPAIAKAQLGFHVTPHGLRHAHASWLLAGGADLQVVKERLGHGSITTTEKYLHSLPTAHDSALNALDAVRGRRSVDPAISENEPRADQVAATDAASAGTRGQSQNELVELRQVVTVLAQKLDKLTGSA
jgi:integrase